MGEGVLGIGLGGGWVLESDLIWLELGYLGL